MSGGLETGMRVRSRHTGRTGRIAHVYDDLLVRVLGESALVIFDEDAEDDNLETLVHTDTLEPESAVDQLARIVR